MATASWLTLLNRALVTLGEDTIDTSATELTDTYHKLLSNFANQIKEEVEEAHSWRALLTEYTVTVAANTPISTTWSPTPTENSTLAREPETLAPMVFDVTDADNPYRLRERDLTTLLRKIDLETGSNYSDIEEFAVDFTSSGIARLVTYPPCQEERTITVYLFSPQGWIADNAITNSIHVPVRPVLIGTIWYALEERGEELGINGIFTEERYRKALDDAIARDSSEQGGLDLVPT